MTQKDNKVTDEQWRSKLTEEQYQVTRCSATEAPFTGMYWDTEEPGIYRCVCCNVPLFKSDTKYDSGTGWPSFWEPYSPEAVAYKDDFSFGRHRIEVVCANCDAHLGHRFPDGPQPSGMRYCINSAALDLERSGDTAQRVAVPTINIGDGKDDATEKTEQAANKQRLTERATLGGGCFWCLEPVFSDLRGVSAVVPGYAGGHQPNPTYDEVCSHKTGHAEVVHITFDPQVITFADLLGIFFSVHDPTTLNRQGNDVGPQYRSIILYETDEQKRLAEEAIRQENESGRWSEPLVTEVKPLDVFYEAEREHHDYYNNNPGQGYCFMVIRPKVERFKKQYAELLK